MRQFLHIILSTMFVKLYLRAAGFYLKSRSWSLPKKLALALLGAALDKKARLGEASDKKALLGAAPDKKPYSGRLQTKSPTLCGSRQKTLLGGAAPDQKALLRAAPDKKPYLGQLGIPTKSTTRASLDPDKKKHFSGQLQIQTKKTLLLYVNTQ